MGKGEGETKKLEEKYITFEVVVVVADHLIQSTQFSRLKSQPVITHSRNITDYIRMTEYTDLHLTLAPNKNTIAMLPDVDLIFTRITAN